MKTEQFNKIVDDRIESIKSVLASKAAEYARDDRLSNLKVAGRMAKCTPERALMMFRLKHEVSIMDIVDDLDEGPLPTKALLREKLGDSINYLILLEACIMERIEDEDEGIYVTELSAEDTAGDTVKLPY